MTTAHRTAATTLLVLSLAAASAPTAGARPPDHGPAGQQTAAAVYSRPDKSLIAVRSPATSGASSATTASVPQPVVRIQTPQSGFDWGDAGIGAAGGLAIAMVGLGGGLVISRHQPRRSRHTKALPS